MTTLPAKAAPPWFTALLQQRVAALLDAMPEDQRAKILKAFGGK